MHQLTEEIHRSQISNQQFLGLISWLKYARAEGKLIFPYNRAEREKFSFGITEIGKQRSEAGD